MEGGPAGLAVVLGAKLRPEPRGRIRALQDRRVVFPFLLPLGKRVSKADPEDAGMGGLLRTGNWPLGHTWSGQERDRKRLPTAWQRASDAGRGLAGLLPSRSRVPGCPGAGFEGHELASPCCSHQFPAATLGIRPSLLGFPLLDSGDRGRQAVRGSVREGASAPSWPPHLSSLHPVTAKPADRG